MPADFQAELAELKTQVAELAKKNKELEATELTRLTKKYEQFTTDILEVVTEGDLLESNFDNLIEKIKDDELFIDLSKMNNPNSDILGFRFIRIIEDLAKKQLIEGLNDKDQPRLTRAINDAVKSPFLQMLVNSNPITLMVSRVVDKVTSFVKSVKGRGGSFVPSIERAFNEQKLNVFIGSLNRYVKFYDSLLQTSNNYQAGVNNLKNSKNELSHRLDNYYNKFLGILGTEATNGAKLFKEIQTRFPPITPVTTKEQCLAVLESEENLKAHKISLKFPELRSRIYEFEIEYYKILIEFFNQNLTTLKNAHSLSNKPEKLTTLQDRIEARITSLQNEITNTIAKLVEHPTP